MTKHRSNDGWREYWQESRLAACVPENPLSAAAIENKWAEFFAGLPDGARILDVATGNGVVLVWAARAAKAGEREFSLTGVDSAAIDPARFVPEHQDILSDVRFLGNTPAEVLPFADNSFDVVVSQYGLEYADLDQALAEASRVLVPAGQLHWLAHDTQSAVVAHGRRQLEDIDLLLDAKGPFAAMKAFIDANERGRKVDPALRELTQSLEHAQRYCAAHPPATIVHQLCGGILNTTNDFEKYRPYDVSRWLNENRQRLLSQRQRIRDLRAAQLSETRLASVERQLSADPWTNSRICPLTVGEEGQPVGRLIHARRC